MPYIENLYSTDREDGNLVNNELLAWLWNLKSSKIFKGEDTNKTLPKKKGGINPLTITNSKTPEKNNKIDL